MQRGPLVTAALAGTVLQVGMVLVGHRSPAVAAYFAMGGMGISLLAGGLYVALAARAGLRRGEATAGGALAGGICALLGIAVSLGLGDVTPILLVLGTLSSVVTGAIGGLLMHLAAGRRAAAPAG
jgi:hypothetical protein